MNVQFFSVEANKRQFSFWLLFFLTVGIFVTFVGVDFWFCFVFLNTSYATTFPEGRNQLCLVKKESEE